VIGYNRAVFMVIAVGQQLGSYEITALLGKGGMGEVYRARDTKLKRDVAIKILPEEFSRDPGRVDRFQREAEVLASLNHPNIAAIYDLAEANGTRFLVLELVEGETLAERIQRGAVPLDEALKIAHSICEALEAAHERRIIHRDLKPPNIKITPDGKVKLLDFGLAKAFQKQHQISLSDSPTLINGSVPGVILGTAAYMSPEQATGKETDTTSDMWAFGCVFYEMLAGRAAFEGESAGEILGGVFKAEPDWSRLPANTPEAVRRLLRRCLQKDRKRRLQSVSDARIEIEEAEVESRAEPRPVRQALTRGQQLAWMSIVAFVALVAAVVVANNVRSAAPTPEMRVDINAPPSSDPTSFAISPDGQKIVFAGTLNGRSSLWLRSLDSASTRPLAGTDNAQLPFWSPDSLSVGFFADGKLKRTDLLGASVQILARAPVPDGGTWGGNDTILFVPISNGPIFRISASGGGEGIPATKLADQETGHGFPHFLPDGTHLVYSVRGGAPGIHIGRLGAMESRRLFDADSNTVYAPTGHLLFSRQGALFARRFDPVRLEMQGNPFTVAEQIALNPRRAMALSVSAAGLIGYRTGSASGLRQFVWFDRSGRELSKVGDPIAAALNPSLSPDGRRLALQRTLNGNTDIWLLEMDRGVLTRFTSDPAIDVTPRWFPDGQHIAFGSARNARNGAVDLYQGSATSSGTEKLLVASPQGKSAMDFTPDGQLLLYRSADPNLGFDIWALPLTGDRKPFPVIRTEFEEGDAQFSPDGKWIAYQSNESGRYEIYVQPFPGLGGKRSISTNGGSQPRWRHDGKELFYIALDGRLTTVPMELSADDKRVNVGLPVPLFIARIGAPVLALDSQQYIVSSDGQRFLINTLVEEANTSAITLILNWKPKP
jgi:eukaryotic-like serine/threonine-protein kinase